MNDHKFTDEEIIKALEHCASETSSEACVGCPFDETGACIDPENAMAIYALSIINRQKAEIERLERGELREAMTFNSATINRCVASAVKEFAEHLKTEMRDLSALQNGDATFYLVGESFIDRIVKEMTAGYTENSSPENDYFTPEEVRKMSRSEVRKNYQAIMNSMSKWGKDECP